MSASGLGGSTAFLVGLHAASIRPAPIRAGGSLHGALS